MARGQIAKDNIAKKLQEVFGTDYIAESGGKHYVWAKDGGERVQIAISLTCPKNPIGTVDLSSAFSDGFDFESTNVVAAPTKFEPAELTQEEKETIEQMMARLGL